MSSNDLPPDLAKLERMLSGGPGPSPSLPGRVMTQVQQELRHSSRLEFWQYAAAVAASVVIALNLGFSAASTPRPDRGIDRDKLAALCEQVDQMQLGLSADEVRRQCLLLTAGDDLVPMGRPYGSATGNLVVPNR